jgi:hypothetical protein
MAALPPVDPARTALSVLHNHLGQKAPTKLEGLQDLFLKDLNITIRNISPSAVQIICSQDTNGDWVLNVSNEMVAAVSNIQRFVHKPETAIFHVVQQRKPTEAELEEVAQDYARKFSRPTEEIREMLRTAPRPISLIDPGQEFPDLDEA